MKIEDELMQIGEELRHLVVPQEALAQARIEGLQRAKRQRKKTIRIWSSLAFVALLMISFTLSIRLSPQFAQSMAKVPGVSLFVDIINTDKGVRDSIAHDYYEVLNVAQTKDNLTFTLQGIIADASGMVLNYKLTSSKPVQNLTPQITILQNGSPLSVSIGQSNGDHAIQYEVENLIHIVAPEGINYEHSDFELLVKIEHEMETTFVLPFTLKKPVAKTKKIALNHEISFEGQKLIVEEIAISPIRAKVTIRVPEDNTMRLLDIEKLQLIDERGEVWRSESAIRAHGSLDTGLVHYYLQSNFFRETKRLALEIGEIQALPKGDDYVEIDLEHKKVTRIPKLVEADIRLEDDGIHVAMPVRKEGENTQLFSNVVDASGEMFYNVGFQFGFGEELNRSIYRFDFEQMKSPIRLKIQNYTNYLQGEEKIDININ